MTSAQSNALEGTKVFEVPKTLLPQPCQLVIFGGPGDLSWRKLLPAVYNLNVDGVLPSHFTVVAFGVPADGATDADPDEYIRARARKGISRFSRQPLDESHWTNFARGLFFVQGSFNDMRAYEQLKARLESLDQQFGISGSRVYYLAVPPGLVGQCVEHLQAAGMVRDPADTTAFTRVIVEKPIGRDLDSARQVNRLVGAAFAESQTYRIDHYLGKETVQNLLVLRFANSIFEPLWNAKCIDHVQITVAEEEGLAQYDPSTGEILATRAGYYEGIGALRDMVQNHMLQVLCVVAMEPPWSLAPEVVRDAKVGVLNCLRPLGASGVDARVVRGQYIEGDVHRRSSPGFSGPEHARSTARVNYLLTASLALSAALFTASLVPSFTSWAASLAASFTSPAASFAALPSSLAASLAESTAFPADSLALSMAVSSFLEHAETARVSIMVKTRIRNSGFSSR